VAAKKNTPTKSKQTRKSKSADKTPPPDAKSAARAEFAEAFEHASPDAMSTFLAQGRPVESDSITYMMRACRADMSSTHNFVWPPSGAVEAPDWDAGAHCGHGLHGWLMGSGDISACGYALDEGAKWLVCAVWSADVVSLDSASKCKVPRAWVLFCGDAKEAA
jgi:hypothetical protein